MDERTAAPGTVTAGGVLLVVAAAAIAFDSLVGLIYAVPVTEAFQQAYAGVEGARFSVLSIRTTSAILLVVAAGLVLLAYLDQRGSATARINTWMLGGLLLCWGGASLFADPGPPRDVPDPAELERLLTAAVPGWLEPATAVSQVVTLVAVAAAMLLLTLPPSRRHFRTGGTAPPR